MTDVVDVEDDEQLTELPRDDPFRTSEIQQMLLEEKNFNPSKFVSHWEMDENDIDEASEDEKQNNPSIRILWAAETGAVDIVTELLERDASLITSVDRDGYTPLHRAAYEGHLKVVELLLDRGATIDAKTADNWTPLHSATYWGQTDVMEMLISRGSNVNAQTAGGQTPLHLAASAPNGGNAIALQIILMNEFVDVTIVNKVNETAKCLAERNSRFYKLFDIAADRINILCENKSEPTERDSTDTKDDG